MGYTDVKFCVVLLVFSLHRKQLIVYLPMLPNVRNQRKVQHNHQMHSSITSAFVELCYAHKMLEEDIAQTAVTGSFGGEETGCLTGDATVGITERVR